MKIFKTWKHMSTKDKLNVIWCTYHSLTDFTHRRTGPSKVARKLNFTQQAVWNMLKRFE